MQMNTTYKFAPVPSTSTVTGLVTVMVSAFFLMANAAVFADPFTSHVKHEALAHRAAPTTVAIAPEARLKITVEAPRLGT
jgi:hypothetical protein